MTRTFRRVYDMPTGYGGFILWLLGGPRLVPAVGYMGGKRTLAPDIGEALDVRPGARPDEVVLADAGCPGWVWPELLTVERAARVADVMRSWKDEGPVELWDRLASLPPAEDPSERAAQVIWLQGRLASNCPLIWEGDRWEMGDKPRRSGQPSRQGVQVSGHVVARAQKGVFQRQRARGKCQDVRSASGLLSPLTTATRIETIARTLSRHRVRFHHGDLFDVIPDDAGPGDLFYFDPDYVGCTSYGATVPRERLLAVAEHLRRRGATVVISEAVPLFVGCEGWYHHNLTRPGGKPEWLTMSCPPTRRQAALALGSAA